MYAMTPYWCGSSYQWMCVPVPIPAPCCSPMIVPFELTASESDDGSPEEAFIGGACAVRPTLEYLVDADAAVAEVTVTITLDGTTTTWSESAIAEGYHRKDDFAAIAPGSIVQLTATDARARLRWCERLCC